jgi:hypothetical protein
MLLDVIISPQSSRRSQSKALNVFLFLCFFVFFVAIIKNRAIKKTEKNKWL